MPQVSIASNAETPGGLLSLGSSRHLSLQIGEPPLATIGPNASAAAARHAGGRLPNCDLFPGHMPPEPGWSEQGLQDLADTEPADAAPEEMTWPCCLRFCDSEADQTRGNDEILPCHGRCQRRNKEGGGAYERTWEGVAGEHAPTLLRLSLSRQPLATLWTMRSQSRVAIRSDTISCGRSPFPGPPFCLGNCTIGRVTRDR